MKPGAACAAVANARAGRTAAAQQAAPGQPTTGRKAVMPNITAAPTRPTRPRTTARAKAGSALLGLGTTLNTIAFGVIITDEFYTRSGTTLLSGAEWAAAAAMGPVGMGFALAGAWAAWAEGRDNETDRSADG